MSGFMLVLLAFFGTFFFAGLAWYGIDAGAFVWPCLAVGILGLVLLAIGARLVLLISAAVVGAGSFAFWAWVWAASAGFDGRLFGILIAISAVASLTALGGWFAQRNGVIES